MKNKGFVKVLVAILGLVCLYQLAFTPVTRRAESKIKAQAEEIAKKTGRSFHDVNKELLDSLRGEVIYSWGIAEWTYQECKEQEINLGLDLQGGMNVTLEVSIPDMVKSLAGPENDPKYTQAMNRAMAEYTGRQNFIDLFASKYAELDGSGQGLARIFYENSRKEALPNQFNSTDKEIIKWMKEEADGAFGRTFDIIKTRIDLFGATQPNVQKLENGRILVELPGADDPKRIEDILQTSAKLDFWDCYMNYDAFQFLVEADKVLGARLKLEADEKSGVDTTTAPAAAAVTPAITPAVTPVVTNDTGVSSAPQAVGDTGIASIDSNKSDTASKDQLSFEQSLIENPFTTRIYPYVDDQKNFVPSAIVGYVEKKNMAFFDKYLNDPEIRGSVIPADVTFKWSFKPMDDAGNVYFLYALRGEKPILDGSVVVNARPTLEVNGEYKVSMTMNNQGAMEWKQITEVASSKKPQGSIAIVLDDAVYSAPTVNSVIPNGQSSIEGNYSLESASDLSNILKAGRMDFPANIVESTVVGPSLGKAAIRAGLISLLVGFFAVILFMMAYYAKAGIYAVIALLANMFFILGVLGGLKAALTLPGMAGLVLTIGMAVDANVLIFERIKEELATGKGFKASIKQGYQAAYSSIIDANVTTLIAAIILYVLGKGPVAGFGIILLIGILSSLFTSIALTRLFVERDIAKGNETSFASNFSKKIFNNFNYNFIGNRKKFYIISSIIILGGMVSLFTKGLSTGVDFRGGWSYVTQIDGASNTEDIRKAIDAEMAKDKTHEISTVEVKTYGADGMYKITTAYRITDTSKVVSTEVKNTILNGLAKYNVNDSTTILAESKVGPTIAEDIKVNSSLAVILSLIGMFLYIVIRFRKWGYGLGATVALFHDVMIVFSIYSIFYGILPFTMDIDQAFIAAILTVVGYSINDTVVVFDRVREFLGSHKYEENTSGVINDAINQTLSRTLVTSLTTLLVVLVLFLFGGEGLKGFTFALLIGVAVGTYSSICIATPIVVDFMQKKKQ
ncbi:MAG: SecD/SecF fusion protein [Bacteroidia bacterium]|jgi:SecD/SecF fusion protein